MSSYKMINVFHLYLNVISYRFACILQNCYSPRFSKYKERRRLRKRGGLAVPFQECFSQFKGNPIFAILNRVRGGEAVRVIIDFLTKPKLWDCSLVLRSGGR